MPTHIPYCKKYIRICYHCNELYDLQMEKEHMEMHEIENCMHCDEEHEAKDMEEHEKQCGKNVDNWIKCKYCSIPVTPRSHGDH